MDLESEARRRIIIDAYLSKFREEIKQGNYSSFSSEYTPLLEKYSQYLTGDFSPPELKTYGIIKTEINLSEPLIEIYTDGSCLGNGSSNAKAGYAVNLPLYPELNFSDRVPGEIQTNNRGELMAIQKALDIYQQHFPETQAIIYTDSKYFINAIDQGWLEKWKNNGWKKSDKKPVLNQDLWVVLDSSIRMSPKINYKWVKAHNGNQGNEIADKLAKKAALN